MKIGILLIIAITLSCAQKPKTVENYNPIIIEKVKNSAIKVESIDSLPQAMIDVLKTKKVIAVGEMHGTKEVPAFFGQLVKQLSQDHVKTLVVLEVRQKSQANIDAFVKKGSESLLQKDEFFAREYQDGRSSQAMFDLIKELSKVKNIKVLAMDPLEKNNSMSGQQRDTLMAENIKAQMKGYNRVAILTGNIHSSLSVGTPWDPTLKPMTYELKRISSNLKEDDFFTLLVRYEKNGTWNCQTAEANSCSAKDWPKFPTSYSVANDWNFYFLNENEIKDGHQGTFFIRTTEASVPFIKK